MKSLLIALLLLGFNFASFSQNNTDCASIKIYNSDFDNVFQFIYQAIDTDSIIAIRHCATSNGCFDTYGI